MPTTKPKLIETAKPINTATPGDRVWRISIDGHWADRYGKATEAAFTARILVNCHAAFTARILALGHTYRLGAYAGETTKVTGTELVAEPA